MSYKKFAKDVGTIGLTNLALTFQGLFILPAITKVLGAENYGLWVQLVVTVSLFTPIITLGFPYALVRFLPAQKNREAVQDGIWSIAALSLALAMIVAAALFFSAPALAHFFAGKADLVRILSLIIVFECLNQGFYYTLQSLRETGKYSFFLISQNLGEAVLVIWAVLSGGQIEGAFLAVLLARSACSLAMLAFIAKKIGFKIPKFLDSKEYAKFGLPNVPANIFNWITRSSDRYFIGLILGTLYVGYYSPAYMIGNAITFFTAPVAFVLPAVLSKLHDENDLGRLKIYISYSLKYFLMVAIPSLVGLTLLAKQLLTIFSTAEIAGHSHTVVPLIAGGAIIAGIGSTFPAIFLKKKTAVNSNFWMVGAMVNLVLNFTLIPEVGIIGAAIANLATYLSIFSMTFCYSYIKYKKLLPDIDWPFTLKSALAAAIMGFFIIALDPSGLLETSAAILLGAVIYGILIFLIKGFSKKEILFFREFLLSRKITR